MAGRQVTGFFPSLKCKASIPYTTALERDYLYLLEGKAALCSYQRPPPEVRDLTLPLASTFLLRFPGRAVLAVLASQPPPEPQVHWPLETTTSGSGAVKRFYRERG